MPSELQLNYGEVKQLKDKLFLIRAQKQIQTMGLPEDRRLEFLISKLYIC